nr:hypothetical protein [Vibrio sp. 04Ya108]
MSTPLKEWRKGEVIGCLSMISPFFLINKLNAGDSIVITHGRRTECMCISNREIECHDIAEVMPISNKERHFLNLIRTCHFKTIFVTDVWWISEAGIRELVNLKDKRVCVFVQYPNQVELINSRLNKLYIGPCDLAISNLSSYEFAGVNIQEVSLSLQYTANKDALYSIIDTQGNITSFNLDMAISKEVL